VSLSQILGVSVGVGVSLAELLLSLLLSCSVKSDQIFDLFFEIVFTLIWSKFFLDRGAGRLIGTDKGSGDVRENFKFFTFVCQLEDADGTVVVSLEQLHQRVIEVDTGGRVDQDVEVLNDLLPLHGVHAQVFKRKVALHRHHLSLALGLEVGPLFKEHFEHMRTENLVEALLKGLALADTHEHVDFLEVGTSADNLLENNLGKVACAPRN
jgi:hypothetical protein